MNVNIREIMAATGKKRFISLIALVVLCAALGAFWQKYLIPQREKVQGEKSQLEAEESKLRTEIVELPKRYDELKKAELSYDAMIARGFTKTQDRIVARQKLDTARAVSGLRSVNYNIDTQMVDNDAAKNYQLTDDLVHSEIKMTFKSLTDLEIRNFIDQVQRNFDGLILLQDLKMERSQKVDLTNLTAFSQGNPVDFISGEADFQWYNVVPHTEAPTANQAFGGAQ